MVLRTGRNLMRRQRRRARLPPLRTTSQQRLSFISHSVRFSLSLSLGVSLFSRGFPLVTRRSQAGHVLGGNAADFVEVCEGPGPRTAGGVRRRRSSDLVIPLQGTWLRDSRGACAGRFCAAAVRSIGWTTMCTPLRERSPVKRHFRACVLRHFGGYVGGKCRLLGGKRGLDVEVIRRDVVEILAIPQYVCKVNDIDDTNVR